MINNISFKAKYINSDAVKIHKPYSTGYIPRKVDYVELDINSKTDVDAVAKIGEKWNYGDSFAQAIAKNMKFDSLSHKYPRKYFAIVEEGCAEKLKPSDILGIAEITEQNNSKEVYLDLIQVIPCYTNDGSNLPETHIKNIGTTLMRNICKTFCYKDIKLQAIRTTKYFYEKLGFERIENSHYMIKKALL